MLLRCNAIEASSLDGAQGNNDEYNDHPAFRKLHAGLRLKTL